MPMFRVRFHTGPTLTTFFAQKVTEAGLIDVYEGTEHVLVTVQAQVRDTAGWNVMAALVARHGQDWGVRPEVLRQLPSDRQTANSPGMET